jgi:hypothetical protein
MKAQSVGGDWSGVVTGYPLVKVNAKEKNGMHSKRLSRIINREGN